MRYCSHCGNPLNVGASFCHNCGAPLKTFVPEADETPVHTPEPEIPETPIPPVEEPTPVVISAPDNDDIRVEKEFLDQTCRLLRWERKALSITGKVMLICGIVFAALFFLLSVIMLAIGDEGAIFGGIFFVYCVIFGGMFIAIGIVNIIAAGKIPQYTDTLYKDFRAANARCNSIGMIIFHYFFNTIAMVFHIINFVRMKTNKPMIQRILTRQGVN